MRQWVVQQLGEHSPANLARARKVTKAVRQWWSHQQTDAYVLSFPGCGRTWLTVLMGKAIVEERGLGDANPARITELARLGKHVPRIEVRHDASPQLRRPEEIERDKSRFAKKDVVLLVRDPRDAIISYYFEASKRRGRFSGTAGEFLRHPIGGLDSMLTYYNVWAENRNVPKRFYVVRYEQLHADTVTELDHVMRTVGVDASRASLERAVEYGRFDNMRKIEQKGFDRPELDRHKAGDTESFKARKGKVGGYREYLSPDDVEYLNRRIADTLSPFYSYYLTPPA
ncbi:MAG TPA: sulfotransferase domain-containing protein [Kofleriaceae bacterium]|nr:sulfotransferase domain-containing protein [Kofleriaceae bacterium]